MEGESAVVALFGPQLDDLKKKGEKPDSELQAKMDAVRSDYEEQLDAKYAGARGFVDAVLRPEQLRPTLSLALRAALHNPGAHLGPFGELEAV